MSELTIIIYSVIYAAFLPYIAKVPLAYAMYQKGNKYRPGYDNQHPREQQRELKGFGARCLAAHENAFEALIVYAIAVLLVIATDSVDRHMMLLAIGFMIFRSLYTVFYWLNWDKLRSSVWFLGIASSFAMMINCLPS